MPNGNLLTVDAYVFQYDATGTNSEIYNTPTGTWSSAAAPSCSYGIPTPTRQMPRMKSVQLRCALTVR